MSHYVLRCYVPVAATLILGLACFNSAEPPTLPDPAGLRAGASREEILESFGPPVRKQSFSKKNQAIWGAIEDFWSKVPPDGIVEIWAYRVDGGTIELYFVDGSQRVQGTGFAPHGAVFEAEP